MALLGVGGRSTRVVMCRGLCQRTLKCVYCPRVLENLVLLTNQTHLVGVPAFGVAPLPQVMPHAQCRAQPIVVYTVLPDSGTESFVTLCSPQLELRVVR